MARRRRAVSSFAVAALVLCAATARAEIPSFDSWREHPVSRERNGILAAPLLVDLDGDGALEVLSPASGPWGTVDASVLIVSRRSPGGALVPWFRQVLPGQPWAAAAADFDGDGDPDVAVLVDDALCWLENDGLGRLRRAVTTARPGSRSSQSLETADLDGDGLEELLVESIDGIERFAFAGGGGFDLLGETLLSFVSAWEVGDVDADGRIDLVALAGIPAELWVHRGDGAGGFGPPIVTPAAERGGDLVLGHLDGDGWLDAVLVDGPERGVIGAPPPPGHVQLRLGLGDGRFGAPTVVVPDVQTRELVLIDADGDALLDLLVALGSSLIELRGDGDGRLIPWQEGGHWWAGSFVTGDVDGDCREDLVQHRVNSLSPPGLIVTPGASKGFARRFLEASSGVEEGTAAVADLDGDGDQDLVIAEPSGLATLLHDAGGSLVRAGETPLSPPDPVWTGIGDLLLRDFDGDAVPDVAVRVGGVVEVLLGDGAGGFDPSARLDAGGPDAMWNRDAAGYSELGGPSAAWDRNGDGRLDLAVLVGGEPPTVRWFAGGGDGSFASGVDLPLLASASIKSVAWARLVPGVAPTLVAADGENLFVLADDGDAFSILSQIEFPLVGRGPWRLVALDHDGDGAVDLAVNESSREDGLQVLRGRGDGTLLAPERRVTGAFAKTLRAADLDGDGRDELIIGDYRTLWAWEDGSPNSVLIASHVPTGVIASGLLDDVAGVDLLVGELSQLQVLSQRATGDPWLRVRKAGAADEIELVWSPSERSPWRLIRSGSPDLRAGRLERSTPVPSLFDPVRADGQSYFYRVSDDCP